MWKHIPKYLFTIWLICCCTAECLAVTTDANADTFQPGGFVRFTYDYQDGNVNSRKTGGNLDFNAFAVNVRGSYKSFIYGAEYRLYRDFNALHYGWVGYKAGDEWTIKAGLMQVPFSNYPYGTYTWYGNLLTNFGFNDTQHLGVQLDWSGQATPWEAQFAYFKNTGLGDYTDPDSYGAHVVGGNGGGGFANQDNAAVNEGDLRVAYVFGKGTAYSIDVNVSGKLGQLYNHTTEKSSEYWATALAVNANLGNWNIMADITPYSFDPKNPAGVSRDTIQMGFLGFKFLMPSRAVIYELGIARTIKLNIGPIKGIEIYNDFNYLSVAHGYKYNYRSFTDTGSLNDPILNDTGAYLQMGPVFTQLDVYFGRNVGFMAVGQNDDSWNTRVELMFGYNFGKQLE